MLISPTVALALAASTERARRLPVPSYAASNRALRAA